MLREIPRFIAIDADEPVRYDRMPDAHLAGALALLDHGRTLIAAEIGPEPSTAQLEMLYAAEHEFQRARVAATARGILSEVRDAA